MIFQDFWKIPEVTFRIFAGEGFEMQPTFKSDLITLVGLCPLNQVSTSGHMLKNLFQVMS